MAGRDRWSNKVHTRMQPQRGPIVRKVPADSVPYGSDISVNGRTVWAAYNGDRLIAVAPTAEEARRKGRDALAREQREAGQNLEGKSF